MATPHRIKSYSGATGHVYQYAFAAFDDTPEALLYRFQVSADRSAPRPVTVALDKQRLRECESGYGRSFSASERYGLAKMALFDALDSLPPESLFLHKIQPTAEQLKEFAERLDL